MLKDGSFRFKQFAVQHDRCSMRVGTDGVLLGAWASCEAGHTILDVGTGSGLIALMMAQRNPQAHITAIDIDHESIVQASENFVASPWSERIEARERNFTDETQTYDLIVSNPPFFEEDTPSATIQMNRAKHTTSLTFSQLISTAAQHLSASGRFSVIIPYSASTRFIGMAATSGLALARRCDIRANNRRPFKRSLLEFIRRATTTHHTTLTLYNETGQRTDEYTELTQSFYL